MVLNGTILFVFFVIVWLTAVTIFLYRMSSHYGALTKGITKKSLTDVLNAILDKQSHLTKKTEDLAIYTKKLEREGGFHLSKTGIIRYNPFSDTGGAQSFSMALLDGNKSGIVITSLYARAGNRWFVKEVEKGKGKELELSKEEESAVSHAASYE